VSESGLPMNSPDMAAILANLGEEYEQDELDHDRVATEQGFIEWMARRTHAAHDALTRITEADDDCFTTLESTVEYVVKAYRAIAAAEEQAADEIERMRPVVDAAKAWRAMCDDAHHDDPRGVEDRLAAAVDAFQKGRTGE
jgi:hypothetical protein